MNSNFSFFQRVSDFSLSNIIIFLILPVRILCDTMPLIPTLLNTLLLLLLLLDFLMGTYSRDVFFCFSWILIDCLVGYIVACKYQHNYVYPVRGFIRYGTYILLFLYFSRCSYRFDDIYKVYTVLVLVQIILCVVQDFVLHQRFSNGTLQNRNHVCYFLAFYMALSMFVYKKTKRGIFLFLFELYLGGMGGALAATGIIFFYFVLQANGKKKILYFFGFFFVVLLGLFVLRERVIEAIQSFTLLPERIASGQVGASSSILWRIVTWFNMIKQMHIDGHIGIGAGMEYGSISSPYLCKASIVDPHNDYVRLYIEAGFLGVFLFICGARFSIKKLKLKNSENRLNKACYYFVLILFVCMTIANLIVQSTLIWFVFISLGQTRAYIKQKEKDKWQLLH